MPLVSILFALVLAAVLVLPPDALRFELLRALRAQPGRLLPVLGWRLLVTLTIALLLTWLVQRWTVSNPAAPTMVVFSGVLTAIWLWMRFWTRTFIADPDHPLFRTAASAIILSTTLSITLWVALFTQAALMVAWVEPGLLLWVSVLVWPLADALMLVWGCRATVAAEWLVQESTQKRWGRSVGTLLLGLALGAIWAVLAQG